MSGIALKRQFGCVLFFFFKQKTAYEIRPCDWSSDVCSSDLDHRRALGAALVVWLIFLPLAVAAAAVMVWAAPAITGAAPALYATLRLATALTLGATLL